MTTPLKNGSPAFIIEVRRLHISMKGSGVNLNSELLAHHVIRRLRAAGYKAWLVGGCVRDLLLGLHPKDFDVATGARPDIVSELFEKSEQVGAHFGVVLVRRNGAQVEVATFRSDRLYLDGRRP